MASTIDPPARASTRALVPVPAPESDEDDEHDLLRLAKLRNALSHFRTVDHASHIDRRAMTELRSGPSILADDARFAISVFVRILAKPAFRFKPDP